MKSMRRPFLLFLQVFGSSSSPWRWMCASCRPSVEHMSKNAVCRSPGFSFASAIKIMSCLFEIRECMRCLRSVTHCFLGFGLSYVLWRRCHCWEYAVDEPIRPMSPSLTRYAVMIVTLVLCFPCSVVSVHLLIPDSSSEVEHILPVQSPDIIVAVPPGLYHDSNGVVDCDVTVLARFQYLRMSALYLCLAVGIVQLRLLSAMPTISK